MTNKEQKITYSLLQQQFSGFEIAEAHGLLIALICSNSFEVYPKWLDEIKNISNQEDENFNEEILKILYEKTEEDLKSQDFSLELLIPDEDNFLNRTDGFISWCQGFLYGFGISGIKIEELDEEGKDFIHYLSAFIKLDRDVLAESFERDVEELALEELIEFVRMSTLMLFYHIKKNETVH